MLFFNRGNRVLAVVLIGIGFSGVNAQPTLSNDDLALIEANKKAINEAKTKEAPDWLNQYDSSMPLKKTPEKIKKWLPAAKRVGDDAKDFVTKSIQKTYGVMDESKIRKVDAYTRSANSPLVDNEELYYFVSFSQPESELLEILSVSSQVDGRVILRGMRPQDRMVNQTAAAMYGIAKEIKPTPKVSIDPRLHKVFNISNAPSMVYRKGNKIVTVKGIASVKWFLDKARRTTENKSLGTVSKYYDITEKDVITEIQQRVAAVDWDAKRKKAMNRYIKRLPDFNLPSAQEDAMYKIDPRVYFHKDAKAKDGTHLAKKGQVVNPIDHFYGQSLTLFVFDGFSEQQKALVKSEMSSAKGKVGLMVSRIDKKKGIKFLTELSNEYKQQVYMLQQRMIQRFQLRRLPVRITLANGEIIIKEFGTRSQQIALDEEKKKEFETNRSTASLKNLNE